MAMRSSLRGKKILFGVCGSIAAFKAAGWVHALVKEGAEVRVVLTAAAARFVTPLTFSALSGHPVHSEMFAEGIQHIALPAAADAVLIAPATAQTIARLAHGLADDLLSAAVLACTAPVLICPAMNCKMLAHPATQRNLAVLREFGYTVVEPECGHLACGEEGAGRLPEWDAAREALLGRLIPQDMAGQEVLITAGPTREPLDPARFLSNRSSGKMGYALARTAKRRGAEVTLISGPVALPPPPGVPVVQVETALEMTEAVSRQAPAASIVVKAAAVADFRAASFSSQKIKKTAAEPRLELVANPDILANLGRNRRPDQLLIGFAAESGDHEAEGRRKLLAKQADLIAVNDILGPNTGFDVDSNQVTLITSANVETLELLSKEETANRIWDKALSLLDAKGGSMELSRSEQKRRIKQLEELAEELATLPATALAQLPADEEVRQLLKESAGLARDGARKRQIKHITKLLREEDSDALYQFLAERKGTTLLRKKQEHELTHLRDALIEEAIAARRYAKEHQEEFTENWSSGVAEEIADKLPAVNARELTRLAFFFAVSRNPRHSRELFRMLHAAQEQQKR